MITIICGNPGAGKTALLTYLAIDKMINGVSDIVKLKSEIKKMQGGGFKNMQLPPYKHLVFTDYDVSLNKRVKAYDIDGYELGLENIYFKTQFIPPYSSIFLDEAQRYYDSRASRYLREEVYNWYQLHRHNDYNVYMTCQRLGNIDINIRAIAERIIVIDNLDITKNAYGQVKKLVWHIHEFCSPDVAEQYCLARERHEHSPLGETTKIETQLPIFNMYDSKGNKPTFYKGNYNRPFDYYISEGYEFTLDSFVEHNNNHYFKAPRGFLKNAEYDKEIEKRLSYGN